MLKSADINHKSIDILFQLFLFQNNQGRKIFDHLAQVIEKEKIDYFKIYNEILVLSLNYFTEQRFNSRDYLKFLSKEINNFAKKTEGDLADKVKGFLSELEQLREIEINQELKYEAKKQKRLIRIIQDFINLSDIETNKLKNAIENPKEYLLSTFFLLGMYQRYSRIKGTLQSDKLVHYIISECAYKVVDFKFNENHIKIVFDEPEDSSVWGSKFRFIKKQFDQINEIMTFAREIEKVKEDHKEKVKIKKDLEQKIQLANKKMQSEINKYIVQQDELKKNLENIVDKKNRLSIEHQNAEKGDFQMWDTIKNLKDRGAAERAIKGLKGDNLQNLFKDFENEESKKLQKTANNDTFLTRSSRGLKSNQDTILDYHWPTKKENTKSTTTETDSDKTLEEPKKETVEKTSKKPSDKKEYTKSTTPKMPHQQNVFDNDDEDMVDIVLKDDSYTMDKIPKDKLEQYLKNNPKWKKSG